MMTDEQITASFKTFTQKRRRDIYKSLNAAEEDRFTAHMEAFNHKMKAKTEQFIMNLPGGPVKLTAQVSQVITSAAKIHAGQLVEIAKQVQIEEIREQAAIDFPETEAVEPTPENMTASGVLSKAAMEEVKKQIENNLGPCTPWHLREARHRMIQSGEFVDDKPKGMFLKK